MNKIEDFNHTSKPYGKHILATLSQTLSWSHLEANLLYLGKLHLRFSIYHALRDIFSDAYLPYVARNMNLMKQLG
ncbi:hypothetical protein AwDysgo_07210 [Bacteroidales bacterium]|nr:hypothetical protein AwDysgo_07210 [Bacteroidales bacterium]